MSVKGIFRSPLLRWHDLPYPGMYAMIQEYTPQPAAIAHFKAHRRLIDIQVLVEGNETIFYAPIATLQPAEYQAEKDYQPLDGGGILLELHAGGFTAFFLRMTISPGEPWVSFRTTSNL